MKHSLMANIGIIYSYTLSICKDNILENEKRKEKRKGKLRNLLHVSVMSYMEIVCI